MAYGPTTPPEGWCAAYQIYATEVLNFDDWSSPFELMCDASDYAIGGAVLGQRKDQKPYAIFYGSR